MAETPVQRVTLRELDYLVAEHVYGWKRWDTWEDQERTRPAVYFIRPDKPHPTGCPEFAEDHNAAFEVVAKMQEDGWDAEINVLRTFAITGLRHRGEDGCWDKTVRADGETVPIAICKAALATKGIKVEVVR